jgi:uncharacterized protein YciI
MKTVVFYESSTASMETIMATYPRHKALVDVFTAKGDILGIGPFDGGRNGSMGIFRSREAADAFLKQDPFILEGLVGKVTIKEWGDTLLT